MGAHSDSSVASTGVELAVRDFGGAGTGIILIPGLGRTLADWTIIAPILATGHHVIALDVRGHGRSGDGPWSWDAATADVTAVADHFRMINPALMGHSLGGMIASMWGRDHPQSAGIINLDGHGNPRPDQYVGLDPKWVADQRAQLETMFKQQMAALDGPLSDAQIVALTEQQKAVAARVGAPEDVFIEGLDRMLETRAGETYLRPSPSGLGGEIYAALDAIDMYAIYREMTCPLLLFNAEDPALAAPGPAWIAG